MCLAHVTNSPGAKIRICLSNGCHPLDSTRFGAGRQACTRREPLLDELCMGGRGIHKRRRNTIFSGYVQTGQDCNECFNDILTNCTRDYPSDATDTAIRNKNIYRSVCYLLHRPVQDLLALKISGLDMSTPQSRRVKCGNLLHGSIVQCLTLIERNWWRDTSKLMN